MVRTLWLVALVASLIVSPAAADDFLGLVSVYQARRTAMHSRRCLSQAGHRRWGSGVNSSPNRAIYRPTDLASPQPVAKSGHREPLVYFGQHDGRVFVGGDTGTSAC
jgi:hypothetical protein